MLYYILIDDNILLYNNMILIIYTDIILIYCSLLYLIHRYILYTVYITIKKGCNIYKCKNPIFICKQIFNNSLNV